VSLSVSMKKSVVGLVLVFMRVHQVPLYGFYVVQFGTVGVVGERVVFMCGTYC